MSTVTFGRYEDKNTLVHRLDPRNKILLMILLMVSIFLPFTVWSTTLIISGVFFIFLLIVMIISKVSFIELFRSVKGMWLLIIFLLIIYIFIPDSSYVHVAFRINNYPIYYDAFYKCGYIILRLIMMLSITMVLTSTTKPMDLTYGLEWYTSPLKVIHFPSHEIAMTLSIALRFIPTLLDETRRIIRAQSSRGIDFDHGGLGKRFKAIISLIIPLFVSSLERSEELANAMEIRGYDPREKRSRYRLLKFHLSDLFSFLLVLALFSAVVALCIINSRGNTVDLIYWIFKVKPLF